MQVVIEKVNSSDDNLVNFSFNTSKDYEATESLEFVQNAFAQLRKDNIGSNEGKALQKLCHNIKTALRKRSGETKIYHNLRNSWPKLEVVPSHSEWLHEAREVEDE